MPLEKRFKILVLFLMIFIGNSAFAAANFYQVYHSFEMDSLILQNKSTGDIVFIAKGAKIKVWSNGKAHKGHFVSFKDNILTIQQASGKKWIDYKTIVKIKDISAPVKNFGGSATILTSIYMFGAAGALAGIGIYSLIEEGTILIVFAIPATLLGIGLLKLGKKIRGPEYNMDDNWLIVEPGVMMF